METRAETVTDRLHSLQKDMQEASEELQLIARRLISFRAKRTEAQALVDGENKAAQSTTIAAPQDPTAAAQILDLQATVATLVSALAAQAPGIVQSMPPQMLANIAGMAATAQQQQQQQQQQHFTTAGGTPTTPQPATMNNGIGTAPMQQPQPQQQLAALVSQVPTPARASPEVAAQAPQLAAAEGPSTRGETLGVSKTAIKRGFKAQGRTRGGAISSMDEDPEVSDEEVAAQLRSFAEAGAARAAAAQQEATLLASASFPTVHPQTQEGISMPPPTSAEMAAGTAAVAQAPQHPQ